MAQNLLVENFEPVFIIGGCRIDGKRPAKTAFSSCEYRLLDREQKRPRSEVLPGYVSRASTAARRKAAQPGSSLS